MEYCSQFYQAHPLACSSFTIAKIGLALRGRYREMERAKESQRKKRFDNYRVKSMVKSHSAVRLRPAAVYVRCCGLISDLSEQQSE